MAYSRFMDSNPARSAYGIDEYGNDSAPPGYNPPTQIGPTQQDADPVKRMARQRLLYALASGLRTPNQGGGFLGGLASGFSGSVMGGQQFQAQRGEEYRQQQKDEADAAYRLRQEQRTIMGQDIERQRAGYEGERIKLERDKLAQPPKPDNIGSEFELYMRDPAKWRGLQAEKAKFATTGKAVDGVNPDHLNKLSDNMRSDKDLQNFTVVRDNYKRIKGTLGLRSGFGDLAAIFSYMRVLDPNSVVRETEFENATKAVGYVQKTYNLPQWWFKGSRLTEEGRKAIAGASKSLYKAQRGTYDKRVKLYERQAKIYNVDPTLVIPDYSDDYDEDDTPQGGASTVEDLGAKYGF